MAIPYCSQADLEVRLGSAAVLKQLADPNSTGSPDPARIQDYLESGAAKIRSSAEVKHDPEVLANLDTDSLRLLRDMNAALSAREAYEKGGQGMAMPPNVESAAARADNDCELLRRGKIRLGRVSGGKVAAINQPAGTVDFDPLGDGGLDANNQPAARLSRAGFLKGFR